MKIFALVTCFFVFYLMGDFIDRRYFWLNKKGQAILGSLPCNAERPIRLLSAAAMAAFEFGRPEIESE